MLRNSIAITWKDKGSLFKLGSVKVGEVKYDWRGTEGHVAKLSKLPVIPIMTILSRYRILFIRGIFHHYKNIIIMYLDIS